MQPPFMTPIPQGVNLGIFYVTGGVKYRNFETLRMNVLPHQLQQLANLGTPAFGPAADGFVIYPAAPTGLAGTDPNTSGIWNYDDGFVHPVSGAGPLYPCPGVVTDLGLGHFGVGVDCGEFQVVNLLTQPDNGGGAFNTTTTVSMTKALNGSDPFEVPGRIFGVQSDPGTVVNFSERIVAPYIEVGVQQASYFDVFWGFSWFTLNKRFQNSYPAVATLSHPTFTDTYHFASTDGVNTWAGSVSPFLSSAPPSAGSVYEIFPQGFLDGSGRPVRTFSAESTIGAGAVTATEIISNQLDFSVYEFKLGGRSWYPLYGLGRIGTSTGMLITPMPYKVLTRSLVIASESVPAAGVTAGDVLIDRIVRKDGTWILRNLGLFFGADMEVALGSLFGRFTLEYDCYFVANKTDDDRSRDIVESMVLLNQTSVQGSASIGARF